MSRSKEIQEKLDLQAKLQRSFGRNTKRVLGWLGTEKAVDTTELNNSKAAFFTLPVMQTGSGLNLNPVASTANRDDIHTVGEFIQSEKKVSSLSKKRRPQHNTQSSGIHRISKDDTRAMVALKRKMRQNQREDVRGKIVQATPDTKEQNGHDESEDEDDDRPVQKASKKSFGLLFSGGKKAKR